MSRTLRRLTTFASPRDRPPLGGSGVVPNCQPIPRGVGPGERSPALGAALLKGPVGRAELTVNRP